MITSQLLAAHNAAIECYRRGMISEQTFEGRRDQLEPSQPRRGASACFRRPNGAVPRCARCPGEPRPAPATPHRHCRDRSGASAMAHSDLAGEPNLGSRVVSGMARKPGTRAGGEFVLFDVTYVDGSQRSNRRVPKLILTGPEGDAAASEFIAKQDREIADKSGVRAPAIKSVRRSGK
jgi:hypothetical protein